MRGKDRKLPEVEIATPREGSTKSSHLFPSPCGEKIENYLW
ncbi:hypothetical protein PL11201_700004 [Planktothrix sp. PCC 11201]|nr:hypothetical protein PL11201_700004 [Planktothrix sp. PCC 11201]